MQPYFFPYIGYWQLYYNCDLWVFLNEVQYNKRSWMSRNRILHNDPRKEFQYISLPIVQHHKGTPISNIVINNNEPWARKIIGQLSVYKRLNAPNYEEVINLVKRIIYINDNSFQKLILNMVSEINEYLGMKVTYMVSSELDFDRSSITCADDWALVISEHLRANEYINPCGGFNIFDESKFRNKRIEIKFLRPAFKAYRQSLRMYTPGLSIIDVLMFNSIDDVNNILMRDFNLIRKEDITTYG